MSAKKKGMDAKSIALIGVLGALAFGLSFTPFGFISIGVAAITTMHIPVIIAGIVGGPRVGAAIGLVFGISSMMNAFLRPSITSVVFYNPLVAIIPRVLIGVVAYYVYVWVSQNDTVRQKLASGVAALLATLTNTVLVLGAIFFFYQPVLGDSAAAAFTVVGTTFVFNSIPEIIAAIVVTIPVVAVLKRVYKGPVL
ncbi:ECF transporter S component [Culicoidibacter larvae]|uniref:ECF transporter S component n=1 Tax=Culicoidibacter larvae TaxID=2579976 RepID=A0A5R8QHB0_9FIRM|nr:ECF transporter S component [Culicoidibacter larvae]TLG76657.1 ECF transporter S component [Culicoidibacter larvae]